MSSDLIAALEANRADIERALDAAKLELSALRVRERDLEALISRAEAALGLSDASSPIPERGRLTLHAALERLLRDGGNRWMTVQELAQAVNESGLYVKRDGSPVEVSQIHARTKNYAALFEKDRGRVRLKETRSTENGDP